MGVGGVGFWMMCLGKGGIGLQLGDQGVIGACMPTRKVNVSTQQWNHGNDRHVVRSREDFTQLFPIHGYFFASFTSESRTTGAGPEMPPSLRTRQKWRTMKMEAMMGMPMQCQM